MKIISNVKIGLMIILIILIISISSFGSYKEGNLYTYQSMGRVDYPGNDISNHGRVEFQTSVNDIIHECGDYPSCVGLVCDQKDPNVVGTCWAKTSMTTSVKPDPSVERYAYGVVNKPSYDKINEDDHLVQITKDS
jgi:hypothetical protein